MDIDVNAIRDEAMALCAIDGADSAYTFYYDQANYAPGLQATARGVDVSRPCFVLGGVAHKGAPRPLDITGFRRAAGLPAEGGQPFSLDQPGDSNALQRLVSLQVEGFLDWLAGERLAAHFLALDPLYWSVVDIVDLIIGRGAMGGLSALDRPLKQALFTVLAADLKDVADLFARLGYPDADRANWHILTAELRDRVERHKDLLNAFDYRLLAGVLDAECALGPIGEADDEAAPNALLDRFAAFFVERICVYSNANHIHAAASGARPLLTGLRFHQGEVSLANYRFVDARDEPGVEVSDALTGLLTAVFSYAASTGPAQLERDRQGLSTAQRRTLVKLRALLAPSDDTLKPFVQLMLSTTAARGVHHLLQDL